MLKWIPCELHTHTLESDGRFTVPGLLAAAKEYGLSCIALTDHNTCAGHRFLTPELEEETVRVIRGIEWTTFFGHMVVLGADRFVDWRDARIDNIDAKLTEIQAAGGVAGVAHPFCPGTPLCTGCKWDFRVKDWSLVNYIEVWSELMPSVQCGNRRALSLWTQLLDQGYRLACTAGKDWHGPDESGQPDAATYLGIPRDTPPEKTAGACLEALRQGRSYMSMGPEITLFAREQTGRICEPGDTLAGPGTFSVRLAMESRKQIWGQYDPQLETVRLVGEKGRILSERPACPGEEIPLGSGGDSPWVRAEVIGRIENVRCQLAVTSPIYQGKP